jgi:hypothetical protein
MPISDKKFKTIQTALRTAKPKHAARGDITKLLNRLAPLIEAKHANGMSHRDITDTIRGAGFELSEHSLAKWWKERKRARKLAASTNQARDTTGAAARSPKASAGSEGAAASHYQRPPRKLR